MKFIYFILFANIIGAYGQFSARVNWTFAELPTLTVSQRRYKCSQKLDFSCECRAASSIYDVGTKEEIHPFCLTPEGKSMEPVQEGVWMSTFTITLIRKSMVLQLT